MTTFGLIRNVSLIAAPVIGDVSSVIGLQGGPGVPQVVERQARDIIIVPTVDLCLFFSAA